MSATRPWMKFYPRDWRADEKLRMCSLAGRGLWMEMLALMHGSERYGHLLITGKAPTDAQLAVLAGAPALEVAALLSELEQAGVFSRSATGAIYSRRMTDDERKARTARKNGKHGGNPKLCNHRDNPPSDNLEDKPPDKGGLKLRGQRTERKSKANALTKSFLQAGWTPAPFGEGSKSKAIFDGWDRGERDRQLEAFMAHHIGQQTQWVDWQQAWSTWTLNSVKFDRSRERQPENFADHYEREMQHRMAAR